VKSNFWHRNIKISLQNNPESIEGRDSQDVFYVFINVQYRYATDLNSLIFKPKYKSLPLHNFSCTAGSVIVRYFYQFHIYLLCINFIYLYYIDSVSTLLIFYIFPYYYFQAMV